MRILFAAIVALNLAQIGTARADCDELRELWSKFSQEVQDVGAKKEIVDRRSDRKDHAVCRGLAHTERDSLSFIMRLSMAMECFGNSKKLSETADSLGINSAKLRSVYCLPGEFDTYRKTEPFTE